MLRKKAYEALPLPLLLPILLYRSISPKKLSTPAATDQTDTEHFARIESELERFSEINNLLVAYTTNPDRTEADMKLWRKLLDDAKDSRHLIGRIFANIATKGMEEQALRFRFKNEKKRFKMRMREYNLAIGKGLLGIWKRCGLSNSTRPQTKEI